MNGIGERLKGKNRVGIDTMAILYLIEPNPPYHGIVRELFELVNNGALMALTSYLTLLEILVKPLEQGRADLVNQYREILLRSRSFTLHPVDEATAQKGAEIRAGYRLKTPDAIHLATAVVHGAQAFVTNDRELRRFREVEVLVLDDFVAKGSPAEN
jgi:predicted nucleic acid-binding protein